MSSTGVPDKDVWREGARVAAIYFILATFWIFLSDDLLLSIGVGNSVQELTRYQTFKGIAFVAVTALLILLLTVRGLRRIRQTQQLLHETSLQFHGVLEASPVAVLIQRGTTLVSLNRNAVELLNGSNEQELIGRNAMEFIHADHRGRVTKLIEEYRLAGKSSPLLEHRLVRKDGTTRDVQIAVAPVTFHGEHAMQILIHDVSGQKREQEQLAYLATHDSLTDHANHGSV